MPTSGSRPPRLANDPDKYVRVVKGGKYQARPYDEGRVRYNLGLFPTRHQARQAVLDFWWGRRPARLRFARPVRTAAGEELWVAVVRIPRRAGGHETVRVGPRFRTAEEAHRAAVEYLRRECGPLPAWAYALGVPA
jgi:hypothetical protein